MDEAVAALLITGTMLGLMRIVTEDALPVPAALLAPKTTAKSPLWVGVPEITPVDVFSAKPLGKPVPL